MVYSTRRFVVCRSVCHFVLVFFSPFSIAMSSLGEERANLSAFRTFVRFALVWFPLPLGVLEGLRFVIVTLPGLFSYLFFFFFFKPPVVCSTDRSKAVGPVLVLLFGALWFILGGDLLYFLSCAILFLVFFSPFSITISSLGRANLSAFRTFDRFLLVWICRFPLPLGVWEGLRFVIVALPGLFSDLFFF